MKNIAAFVKCNRSARIRIFVDVKAFDEIINHLRKHKTHNLEFEEILSLILEGLSIRDKYCIISSDYEDYNVIILSRGKTQACILCKEIIGIRTRDIVLIKLIIGKFENIKGVLIGYIKKNGGFDYDFEK